MRRLQVAKCYRDVECCEHAQKAHGRTSLLKTVVLGVGLGRSLYVQTTDLDESGRLLSVRSTGIFEMFAESERVIKHGVPKTSAQLPIASEQLPIASENAPIASD